MNRDLPTVKAKLDTSEKSKAEFLQPMQALKIDQAYAAWGIGREALVTSSPCPMPHSLCPKTTSPCGWSFS
ncbi:MAG: hypothetical protein AB3A66_19735 [Nodularia sp. CChRGM 3473]